MLYHNLLFSMCLSDAVSFPVYMKMFQMFPFIFLGNVQKCEHFRAKCFLNVYTVVFPAGNITGMVGGNYYWYGRR